MKKRTLLTIATCFAVALLSAQNIRVLSNEKVGEGWYPRLNENATELQYLQQETDDYSAQQSSAVYVSNEDLKLVLYRNGERKELIPHGSHVNYIWASLSPDQTKIVFNTKFGTAICDLQGKELINLGQLDAPVWYGNDYIVGMYDTHDGHNYTGSAIAIRSIDGRVDQVLTDAKEMGMYPSVSAKTGKIAYNTLEGDLHLMQLNLTDEPIVAAKPRLVLAKAHKSVRRMPSATQADFKDFRIYINPGHGGHDPNDRNMAIYPFKQGDPEGFWESNSNLQKGLKLRDMLEGLGFQTMMSRITNTTADDRSLSAIVAEANAYKANFMLSIHSNAGGPSNYVLQLYAGIDPDDKVQSYPTATPCSDESRAISTIIGNSLMENTITNWSASVPRITGDKTFGRTAMGWSDGYGVLRGLKVPGVISEGRMHDYIPETYRMMNADYNYSESWFFMRSFCKYFMNYELPTGVIGGQVRDAFNKQTFPDIKRQKNTRDELLPIDRAKVVLLQDGKELATYQTDTLYNGVFFFWDLNPGKYTVRVEADHYYELEHEIEVTANQIAYQDFLVNMKRETRPEVISYSPKVELTDSVEVATPIVLNFNWDMMEEPTLAAFSISPEVEGTLAFENSQRTLRFTPKVGYEKATEYTVTLRNTACHPDSNFPNTLEKDFVIKFRTKNRSKLSVIQSYPEQGANGVDLLPTIMLLFDNKLDSKTTKANMFVISDGKDYSVSPAARYFKVNKDIQSPYGSVRIDMTGDGLQPNTQYTLTIDAAVKDTNSVILSEPYVLTFSTKAATEEPVGVLLNAIDSLCFSMNSEKSVGVADKSIMYNTSKKSYGKGCTQIDYEFADQDADEYIFLSPLDLTQIFTDVDSFAIDVYGDLSYNKVSVEFSTEGDIHFIPLCELNYAGWKQQVVSLKDLPENVEFQFTGIRIQKGTNLTSKSGSVMLDALRKVYGTRTGVDNVAYENITILPNPVETVLTVMGVEDADLQLFSADGKAVGQAKGNRMDVSSLPAGNYFLLIKQDGETIYRPVMKK